MREKVPGTRVVIALGLSIAGALLSQPTVAASPRANLAGLLADPPGGYTEVDPGITDLKVGQLDAAAAAAGWLERSHYLDNGFIQGQRRVWKSGQTMLAEEVDQFDSGARAKSYVDAQRSRGGGRGFSGRLDFIGMTDSGGFKVDGTRQAKYFLARGEYAYVITVLDPGGSTLELVESQSNRQYDRARNEAASFGPDGPFAASPILAVTCVLGVLGSLIVGVTVVLLRVPPPAKLPAVGPDVPIPPPMPPGPPLAPPPD